MEIFVDESGTFVSSGQRDSWNVCAALVVAEQARPRVIRALRDLKRRLSIDQNEEAKMDRIDEPSLLQFLSALNDSGVVLFVSAVDSGLSALADIKRHQEGQVDAIRRNVPHMIHAEGKAMVEDLAARVERLSPQLYAQLTIHMDLVHRIISHSFVYFAQWWPASLGRFAWRIDQKGVQPGTYETVAQHLTPALLQTRSIGDPAIMLIGANYSHLAPFEYTKDTFPEFLKEHMPHGEEGGLDLGKILTNDLAFVDSKTSKGVQAVDILASSIRRCFRGRFSDAGLPLISAALGRLMLQEAHNQPPIHLLTLGRGSPELLGIPLKVTKTMIVMAKRMLRD